MAPDRRDAQPAQAVQIQAIPAAGAVTGERMRGPRPGGDGHQGRIARHQREANANQRGASVRLSNRVCQVGREIYPRQTPRALNSLGQPRSIGAIWVVLIYEGDDDLAVVALLVVTPKQVGD